MLLTHKRNGEILRKFEANNAIKSRQLMSINLLKFDVENDMDIQIGDEILLGNSRFYVSRFSENQNDGRIISVEAKGTEYLLQNILILSEEKQDNFTYSEITLEELLTSSVYRTAVDNYSSFSLHFIDIPNEILQAINDIEFSEDTIYSATQKICEIWGIEFIIRDFDIYFEQQVGVLEPEVRLYANINTNVIERNIDSSDVVTRIYPKGSTDNLPPNYMYTSGLRATVFDIDSGNHIQDNNLTPPRNLFYDSDNIDINNPIEKIVTFDDIKVHLRQGECTLTVDKVDEVSGLPLEGHIITSKPINDLVENRYQTEDKDGNPQVVITLYLKAELYNITGATIKSIDKANNRIDFIFPSEGDVSSFPLNLDSYHFLLEGYISNNEINKASKELANKALEHLELNKYPKVTYTLSSAISLDRNEFFDIGDNVYILDESLRSFSEFEEEDIRKGLKVRIQKYEFDVSRGYYTSIEVSNKPIEIPYNVVKTQKELKKKIRQQELSTHNSAVNAYKAEQKLNRLLKHHFYGSPEEYLKIGAEDRNYSVTGLQFDPNRNDEKDKITFTDSIFAINKDPLVTVNIYGRTSVQLTPHPGTFYMYIRIKKGTEGIMGFDSTSLDNTIMFYDVNNGKIESEDDTYYYFLLGLVETYTDKIKVIDASYGFTYIDGNRIYTGTVYADEIRVGSQLETQSSNWDDVYTDWNEKNEDWNTAYTRSSLITEITSDDYIDPSEKKSLKQRINEIEEQKTSLINFANNNSTKFEVDTEVSELQTAFNTLSNYLLNTININDVTSSTQVTTTIRNNLNTYFSNFNATFEALRNKIESDVYGHADSAVEQLNDYSSQWSTAYSRTEDMTTDLKIDIAEKKSLQKQLQNIKKQVNSMVTFAAEHNTSDLTTTERNALTNASNNGSLDVYEDYLINTLLINDLTKSETITQTQRDDLNTKTDNLNGDIQDLRNKLEEVIYSKADLAFENAASKAKVFYGSTTPSSPNVDDIWMRTTEGYRGVWRYNGSSWVKVDDEKALNAYEEAQSASALASSKAKVFYQETEPTSGMVENDLWLDTTVGVEKLYVYDGASWVEVENADLNTAITAVDNWKGTDYTNINGGVITTGEITDKNSKTLIDLDTGYARFGEVGIDKNYFELYEDNGETKVRINNGEIYISSIDGEYIFSPDGVFYQRNGMGAVNLSFFLTNQTKYFWYTSTTLQTNYFYLPAPIPRDRLKYFYNLKSFQYLYKGEDLSNIDSNIKITEDVLTDSNGDVTAIALTPYRDFDGAAYTYTKSGGDKDFYMNIPASNIQSLSYSFNMEAEYMVGDSKLWYPDPVSHDIDIIGEPSNLDLHFVTTLVDEYDGLNHNWIAWKTTVYYGNDQYSWFQRVWESWYFGLESAKYTNNFRITDIQVTAYVGERRGIKCEINLSAFFK